MLVLHQGVAKSDLQTRHSAKRTPGAGRGNCQGRWTRSCTPAWRRKHMVKTLASRLHETKTIIVQWQRFRSLSKTGTLANLFHVSWARQLKAKWPIHEVSNASERKCVSHFWIHWTSQSPQRETHHPCKAPPVAAFPWPPPAAHAALEICWEPWLHCSHVPCTSGISFIFENNGPSERLTLGMGRPNQDPTCWLQAKSFHRPVQMWPIHYLAGVHTVSFYLSAKSHNFNTTSTPPRGTLRMAASHHDMEHKKREI